MQGSEDLSYLLLLLQVLIRGHGLEVQQLRLESVAKWNAGTADGGLACHVPAPAPVSWSLWWIFEILFLKKDYLFEKEREKQSKILSIDFLSISKCSYQWRVGQAETRNQEFYPGPSTGVAKTQVLEPSSIACEGHYQEAR